MLFFPFSSLKFQGILVANSADFYFLSYLLFHIYFLQNCTITQSSDNIVRVFKICQRLHHMSSHNSTCESLIIRLRISIVTSPNGMIIFCSTDMYCDPKRTKKFSKTLSHLTNVVGNDCIYEEKGLLCDEPIRVGVGYIPRPWSHNPIPPDCIINWFTLHWIRKYNISFSISLFTIIIMSQAQALCFKFCGSAFVSYSDV